MKCIYCLMGTKRVATVCSTHEYWHPNWTGQPPCFDSKPVDNEWITVGQGLEGLELWIPDDVK